MRAAVKSAAKEEAAKRRKQEEEAVTRRTKREAEEEAARLNDIKKSRHSDSVAGVVPSISPIGSSPDSSARDSDSAGISPLPQLSSVMTMTREESSDDGALSDNEIHEQLLSHFIALRLSDPNNVKSRMLRKYTELKKRC